MFWKHVSLSARGRDAASEHDVSDIETKRLPVVYSAALTLLAAILLAFRLGRRTMAADEATSYFIAQLDLAGFWESLRTSEANGSLFYLALRFWRYLGGSEWLLRALPALFAAAAVPLLFAIARRLFNSRIAAVAGLLMAVNSFFVAHGQEARSYSLALLLVTLSTYLFVRCLEKERTWAWPVYVLVSAFAIYAHFFSAFVVAVHFGVALVRNHGRDWYGRVALTYCALVVLIGPLVYFVLFNDVGQVDWIPDPTPKQFLDTARALTGARIEAAGLALIAVAVIGVVLAAARTRSDRWRLVLIAGWLVVPLVGAYLISLVKPLLVARYLLIALPGLALSLAVVINELRLRLAQAVLFVAVVAFSVHGLAEWYSGSMGLPWDSWARVVAERERPSDGLIFYAPTIIRPFGYYAGYYGHGSPDRTPPSVYPDELWLGFSRTRFTPDLESIERRVSGRSRIWYVEGYARTEARRSEAEALESLLARACVGPPQRVLPERITLYTECDGAP